jgi:hypothetical protein
MAKQGTEPNQPDGTWQPLFGLPGPDTPISMLFVSVSMTGRDESQLSHIDSLSRAVERAAERVTTECERPWYVRVHIPSDHSAPWLDDKPAPEVFAATRASFVSDVDALVLIVHRGGSIGCGQEFAWACLLGIPVLVLHHKSERISREVEGATDNFNVRVRSYGSTLALESYVGEFLTEWRSTIQTGPERRAVRVERARPISEAIRNAWKRLDEKTRDAKARDAGLPRARVALLASSPAELVGATHAEVLALCDVLEIDIAAVVAQSSSVVSGVGAKELAALKETARTLDWGAVDTLEILEFASNQMAQGGTRRFGLTTTEGWVALRDAWARNRPA